MGLTVNLY